jgi:CRISPR system Cascade subunit CasC
MKLIELHILQSYPVSCLNRDDVGAPKSAVFGGAPRARISSQCLKRAVRLAAAEDSPNFQGVRSRLLKEPFKAALLEAGVPAKDAEAKADEICATFSKQDSKNKDQVTTAVYLSPGEIKEIAKAVAGGEDVKKAVKKAQRLDAADIALFGRMVANDHTLDVQGAAMFSHALSTHKASNDIDFYSAVDDRKAGAEDAGAGMIGTLEFVSATYYRYVALNLGLLASPNNLGPLSDDERRQVVKSFLKACLMAVPGARRNSMNAATLPFAVLGLRKDKGQPVQLINAFEEPIKANGKGLVEASREAMKAEHDKMKATWGIETTKEVWIPETNLNDFIEGLTDGI